MINELIKTVTKQSNLTYNDIVHFIVFIVILTLAKYEQEPQNMLLYFI